MAMVDRRSLVKGAIALSTLAAMPFSARAQSAKVKAPFPIFDTHAHFYTNDIAHYPTKPDISPAAKEKVLNTPMTHDVVTKYWDNAGILMGCGVQYNTVYNTDNSYLLDVCKSDPGRVLPVVILHGTDPTTPDRLRKMAKENSIAGVRLFGSPINGEFEFFTDAALPAWNAIDELGIVAVLMLVGGDLNRAMGRVHEFAIRYPNVRIELDHLGYPTPKSSPSTFGLTPNHLAVRPHRNLYWKLTSFHIKNQLEPAGVKLEEFFDYVKDLYGADRMMWGSDMGNTPGTMDEHYAMLQQAIDATAHWTYADRKAFFFDTPFRCFVPGGTRKLY
ncbi:amidohydrolase family protein [Croceibacterium aestuarii]|uniref:amidohydrolase family protein n=1 Tax=Croceibacterium aestuarii TaxID=3064139 RepID=UPI00272EB9C3|nr:amidohydrolase family protein [Croceibacterium sp. D39]